MSWINRLLGSFRKDKLEDQLNDELQFHIEMRTQEFVAAGMTAEEARQQAARLFGNQLLLKERTREMDTVAWLETLLQDLRYALRILRRSPGFAVCGALAGTGHWSDHGDLQFGKCSDAQDAPGKAPGTACGYQLDSEDMAPDFAQRQHLGPARWSDYGLVDFLFGVPPITRAKPGAVGSLCLCRS